MKKAARVLTFVGAGLALYLVFCFVIVFVECSNAQNTDKWAIEINDFFKAFSIYIIITSLISTVYGFVAGKTISSYKDPALIKKLGIISIILGIVSLNVALIVGGALSKGAASNLANNGNNSSSSDYTVYK